MRGAIYTRISTDEKGESFSIPAQVAACQDYARRAGIIVPDQYVIEEEMTGTVLDRPGMRFIQDLLDRREIAHLIVMKVNRIARKSHLADYFLQEVIFPARATLHIVEWGRPVNPDKNDIIMFGMQSQFSQYERNDIIERTKRGREQKAKDGIWLGQGTPVYGYQKIGTRRNTTLALVPEEAEIVRWMYSAFIGGMKISKMVKHLIAQVYPSPSERSDRTWQTTRWNDYSVRTILQDERYTGRWVALRWQSVPGNPKAAEPRPREEQVIQERPELAIIDRNTWLQAQEIFAQRRDKWRFQPKYNYLMRKRLRCKCGFAMIARSGKSGDGKQIYRVYRCSQLHHRRSECDMPNVRVIDIDTIVWDTIEHYMRNIDGSLRDHLLSVQANQADQRETTMITKAMLEERQASYERELHMLYKDLRAGLITEHIYGEKKAELDRKLAILRDMYQEQQAQEEERYILTDQDIDSIIGACETVADALDVLGNIEFEDKRELIEMLDLVGRFAIEDGELVLYLDSFGYEFFKIPLASQKDEKSIFSAI